MALIVYGGSLSPFVRKVLVVMAEKGIDHTVENVNPFTPSPDFMAISPLKRIPVLRDTDVPEPNTLPDSSIICDYLEHKFPDHPVYPKDPFLRARALWFEEYADGEMAPNLVRTFFFERVVKKMMGQETDEAICAKATEKNLPKVFAYLETELGDNQFLVGHALSIADIAVASMFVNMGHAGVKPDASAWPRLAAFVERMHGRPSFKSLIEKETPLVQRFRPAA